MSCLHYHSFETAVLAPFSSYAVGFSMLCNPASVRILLQFSPAATKQITYSPQRTHPLFMDSLLPGSSHKQSCSFLPWQLISQMFVHLLTKVTSVQTTTHRTQF